MNKKSRTAHRIVHFYGAKSGPHRCFSQWYLDAPFTVDGVMYSCMEQFMMAEKARLFGDAKAGAAILASPLPKTMKQLGRKVRGFDETVWEQQRLDIVIRGNRAKFAQHPKLAAVLRDTGDALLAEASPYDCIWGIGLAATHAHTSCPDRWPGQNLLGQALMTVRGELAGQ
jgi:ribA/ribD-fused uncharacterized protein